jgi:ParB/RepB/Spo0J family partition protein
MPKAKPTLEDLLAQNAERDRKFAPPQAAPPRSAQAVEERSPARWIDISLLDDNPYQPRLTMDQAELEGLVNSINSHGQVVACTARPHPHRRGRFQLAQGHRRKEAVKLGANAGAILPDAASYIGQVLCVVQDRSDEQMLDAAFEENEQRAGFSVFDRANYYLLKQRMLTEKLNPGSTFAASSPEDSDSGDPDNAKATRRPIKLVSFESLVTAEKLPITARMIRNLVEVLHLPQSIQNRLPGINLSDQEGRVVRPNEKHCRALLSLQPAGQVDPKKPPNASQKRLLEMIEAEKLSGNEALRRAEEMRRKTAAPAPPPDQEAAGAGAITPHNGATSAGSGHSTSGHGAGARLDTSFGNGAPANGAGQNTLRGVTLAGPAGTGGAGTRAEMMLADLRDTRERLEGLNSLVAAIARSLEGSASSYEIALEFRREAEEARRLGELIAQNASRVQRAVEGKGGAET